VARRSAKVGWTQSPLIPRSERTTCAAL
jgi:hypothetical protein